MSSLKNLNGFDMVLSISNDALNAQLQHLYDQPVPNSGLTLPGTKRQPRKYLIDHEIVMQDSQGNTINGNIACPTVSWDKLSSGSRIGETLLMSIKFLTGSKFKYWKYDPTVTRGPPYKLTSQDVTGYSFTFEASLGAANIQQIEEDLLHPGVKHDVTTYIASEDFLVSSLFCLFESAQIAGTMKLTDPSGNSAAAELGNWVTLVASYFSQFKDGNTPGKNPFILGFYVTQKPAAKAPTSTPVFAPKSFQFSTTSNMSLGGASQVPTLNFLMLTGSNTVDRAQNPGLGLFDPSFFTTVGYQPGSAKPHDGLLAVSSQLFNANFLSGVRDSFWYGAPPVQNHSVSIKSSQSDMQLENSVPLSQLIGRGDGTGVPAEHLSQSISWETNWNIFDSDSGIPKHDSYNGTSSLNIYCTSDNLIGSSGMSADAQRRILVSVFGELTLHYMMETSPRPPDVGVLAHQYTWSQALSGDTKLSYQAFISFSCGADGQWIATVDTANSRFPSLDSNGNVILDSTNTTVTPYGLYKISQGLSSFFDQIFHVGGGNFGLNDSIKSLITKITNVEQQALAKSISSQLNSLSTKIIMPAGDVFQFDGLNIDRSGHIYTGITYATISGGTNVNTNKTAQASASAKGVKIAAIPASKSPTTLLQHSLNVQSTVQSLLHAAKTAVTDHSFGGFPNSTLRNTVKMLESAQTTADAAVKHASLPGNDKQEQVHHQSNELFSSPLEIPKAGGIVANGSKSHDEDIAALKRQIAALQQQQQQQRTSGVVTKV